MAFPTFKYTPQSYLTVSVSPYCQITNVVKLSDSDVEWLRAGGVLPPGREQFYTGRFRLNTWNIVVSETDVRLASWSDGLDVQIELTPEKWAELRTLIIDGIPLLEEYERLSA